MTATARSQLKFSNIGMRLIVFLLIMLLPVLCAIYWFVDRENTRYTDETINSNLNIGADVFDFSREEHKNTLLSISNALTRDWGFRNAFGAYDAQNEAELAQFAQALALYRNRQWHAALDILRALSNVRPLVLS